MAARNSTVTFRWFSALVFNILMVGVAVVLALLIAENKRAIGEEYITSGEAVSATRDEMDALFAALVPEGVSERNFWSGEIETHLRSGDLTTVHGLLLAAPAMLNRQDANAIMAAANAETEGSSDDRLRSAATLFLPDDVRALYERETAPTQVESLTIALETGAETPDEDANEEAASDNPDTETENSAENVVTPPELLPEVNPVLNVLGSERDLAFQSANWLRGDRTDVFSLSVSGLGLASERGLFSSINVTDDALRGASLVKSARRADRLDPEFEARLERALEETLPAETLKAELEASFNSGGSILIPSDAVLPAFVRATDEPSLSPFIADLERIARLAGDRPDSATLTLLEAVSTNLDLKRAELLVFSGGDRAIALTHYYGSDTLQAAKTVVNWTMRFISLVMGTTVLLVILFWIAFSVLGASFNRAKVQGKTYRQ